MHDRDEVNRAWQLPGLVLSPERCASRGKRAKLPSTITTKWTQDEEPAQQQYVVCAAAIFWLTANQPHLTEATASSSCVVESTVHEHGK